MNIFPENPLGIDPHSTIDAIINLLQSNFEKLHRKLAILGLSGGLDSSLAATLSVRALGAERTRLYYLPERDSKPIHEKHARKLADWLGADLKVIRITPALRKLRIYSLLPLNIFPGQRLKAWAVNLGRKEFLEQSQGEFLSIRLNNTGGDWVARGNAYASAKHRIRAAILYREAEKQNGLVVGAANRTEWLTGTFTQWGCDHAADVMPLLHLYRSQLEVLAEYLELPSAIRSKPADPDLLPGLNDKGALLGSFKSADQILWGLENGLNIQVLMDEFGTEQVQYIQTLVKVSSVYRETPYSLL